MHEGSLVSTDYTRCAARAGATEQAEVGARRGVGDELPDLLGADGLSGHGSLLLRAKECGELLRQGIIGGLERGQIFARRFQTGMPEARLNVAHLRADLLHRMGKGVSGGMHFTGFQMEQANISDGLRGQCVPIM